MSEETPTKALADLAESMKRRGMNAPYALLCQPAVLEQINRFELQQLGYELDEDESAPGTIYLIDVERSW